MLTSTPVLIGEGIGELLPMERGGTPDRHVSYLIRKLCLRLGHFKDTGEEPDIDRMELGSAFEDAIVDGLSRRYARAHPHRFIKPGELELDGLLGNPDLFDCVDCAVIEIKLTWMSAEQDPEGKKFWKYWIQLMAYCKMMGILLGRLHVGHIMGDWDRSKGLPRPQYKRWERRFTQREVDNNWVMLQNATRL